MLGIDVGTTSVRVVAFTVDGQLAATHVKPYPISRPRPGWAEQDPMDWWNGTQEGLRSVLAGLGPATVRSVGIVSQVNTHVFVDSSLEPLAPAIIWQDQRCADIARAFDERFTLAEKKRIWGGPVTLDASFVAARAEWFAREHPSLWAKTSWVLSPKDFVAAMLTGRVATDPLSGVRVAGASGYFPEAVALVDGLSSRLPEILPPTAQLGTVLDLDASLVVGTMDAYGSVFGTATTTPGRGMVLCGTSLVVAGASRQSLPASGVVAFPPRDGLYVHAGPTQAAGDALRWWSGVCGLTIAEVLDLAAAGSDGVVFTPHLLGERAPLWDPDVRGSFLGLSSSTTQADMSRAVLTGVAMSGRHVLEFVTAACGRPLSSLSFSGGGSRSDVWAQIHADVLGHPVERLKVHDSAALGAALLGAVGAGIYPDINTAAAETVAQDRVFTPSADTSRMAALYSVYRSSYSALQDIHATLARWR